jgi:hypothetical protein
MERHDNICQCGQQPQGIRSRLAFRDGRDVSLDAGTAHVDKFETKIPTLIRNAD